MTRSSYHSSPLSSPWLSNPETSNPEINATAFACLPRGRANVAPRTEPKAAVVKRVSSEPGTARMQNPLHPVNPVDLLALLDEVVNSHPLYNFALISQFTL